MFVTDDNGKAKLFSLRNQGIMLACWFIMSLQLAAANLVIKAVAGKPAQHYITLLNTETDYD